MLLQKDIDITCESSEFCILAVILVATHNPIFQVSVGIDSGNNWLFREEMNQNLEKQQQSEIYELTERECSSDNTSYPK